VTGEMVRGGPQNSGVFKFGLSIVRFLVLSMRKSGESDTVTNEVMEVGNGRKIC